MHVKNIHCMIEELAEGLKTNVTKSMKPEEVKVLGETVDMLKDLCEAEYYARISKAMEEAEKDSAEEARFLLKQMKEEYGDEEGERIFRMGYNRNRYANGRYAPKGRGRRMGYMPPMMDGRWDEDDYLSEYLGNPEIMSGVRMRMGYGDGGMNSGSRGGNYGGNSGRSGGSRGGRSGYGDGEDYGMDGRSGRGEGSRYGRSYDSYRENRRHYTETKDEKSKKDMEMSMKEYTEDVMDNIKEMWRDADPALRQTMKADLTKMVQQLQ